MASATGESRTPVLSAQFLTKHQIATSRISIKSKYFRLSDTWSVAPIELTEEVSLHLGWNGVVCDGDGVAGGVKAAVTWCQGKL